MPCASEIMAPAHILIDVRDSVPEALAALRAGDQDRAVVLDEDEPVGYLDRDALFVMEAESPGVTDEMVGNVMETGVRVCRGADTLAHVRALFDGERIRVMIVRDETGRILGHIPRAAVFERERSALDGGWDPRPAVGG